MYIAAIRQSDPLSNLIEPPECNTSSSLSLPFGMVPCSCSCSCSALRSPIRSAMSWAVCTIHPYPGGPDSYGMYSSGFAAPWHLFFRGAYVASQRGLGENWIPDSDNSISCLISLHPTTSAVTSPALLFAKSPINWLYFKNWLLTLFVVLVPSYLTNKCNKNCNFIAERIIKFLRKVCAHSYI